MIKLIRKWKYERELNRERERAMIIAMRIKSIADAMGYEYNHENVMQQLGFSKEAYSYTAEESRRTAMGNKILHGVAYACAAMVIIGVIGVITAIVAINI